MLDTNRLLPPRPFSPPPRRSPAATGTGSRQGEATRFVSAEDFDATGILTGVDLCASSYWWMPELHDFADVGPSRHQPSVAAVGQATARISSRTSAAA